MTQKHTPGPWVSEENGLITPNGGSALAVVANAYDEHVANAQLIASAPDGLEAAEFTSLVLDNLLSGRKPTETEIKDAKIALDYFIFKARGE